MKLINLAQASKKHNLHRRLLVGTLEAAGVQPHLVIKHGRGDSALFDEEKLDAAIAAWRERQAATEKAIAAANPTPAPGLAEIEQSLAALTKAVGHLMGSGVEDAAHLERIESQNQSLFRAAEKHHEALGAGINDVNRHMLERFSSLDDRVSRAVQALGGVQAEASKRHEALLSRLDRLTTLVENISAVALAPAPIHVVKQPTLAPLPGALAGFAPPQARLPRVLIVGVNSNQRTAIQTEFGQLLDLRFVEGVNAKGKDFLAQVISADHIVLMTKYIGHTASEVVKDHKVPYTLHNGSVSSLSDPLTALAVSLNEAKKAA